MRRGRNNAVYWHCLRCDARGVAHRSPTGEMYAVPPSKLHLFEPQKIIAAVCADCERLLRTGEKRLSWEILRRLVRCAD